MSGSKEQSSSLHGSSIALASAAATLITKSSLHPLDTLKCRLQSSNSRRWRSFWGEYAGKWGPQYLYGGLLVKLTFYVPYQAVYMTTYSGVKTWLQTQDAALEGRAAFLARTIFSAVAAELASCVVRVPMETMKIRIQTATTESTQAAVVQLRRNGFLACAGLVKTQTFLHDMPFSIFQWIFYETFCRWVRQLRAGQETSGGDGGVHGVRMRLRDFACTFLSGGFSGFLASAVTVPLDTVRTRVVVATATNPAATIRGVVRDAYHFGGVRLFFRGGFTRIFWVTANTAMYLPLFEFFKTLSLPWQDPMAGFSGECADAS